MKASVSNESGFTLVEVLISLFIFALISAGTMGAMFQTFAAKERLDMASAELADIAAFRSILRADLGAMDLRAMRDGVGGTENYLATTRDPAAPNAILTFTRLGRSNPTGVQRGQAERVRYIIRDNQFIRETLTHENPAERDGWAGRVLLDGVENISVIYRNNVAFGSSSPVDLVVEEWRVLLEREDKGQALVEGALEFKLTDARGSETVHLFELGI